MAENYTIVENFTLPSLGKVYTPEIDPIISLRSMTTAEEMRRLSPQKDYPYKALCDIIDACTTSEKHISSYDMCLGDYQYLLYMLRVVTYGPDISIHNKCPYCGVENSDSLSLDDLEVIKCPEDYESLKEFDLPNTKKHIVVKHQTPRMLDRVEQRLAEYRRKSQTKTINPSVIYSIAELIDTVDGEKLSSGTLESWLTNLNMMDMQYLYGKATKLNDSVGVDSNLYIDCDFCGLTYKTSIGITQEFFRPSLDI